MSKPAEYKSRQMPRKYWTKRDGRVRGEVIAFGRDWTGAQAYGWVLGFWYVAKYQAWYAGVQKCSVFPDGTAARIRRTIKDYDLDACFRIDELPQPICRACLQPPEMHVGGCCLFASTKYDPSKVEDVPPTAYVNT